MAPAKNKRDVAVLFGVSALLIAAQVIAKAERDSRFLSQFAPERLPWFLLGGTLLSVLSAAAAGRLFARYRPRRALAGVLVATALGFVLIALGRGQWPRLAAVLLYLQVASTGGTIISAFWLLVNERFDPRRARQRAPQLVAWGCLGGLVGGIGTERVAALAGPSVPLWIASAALCVAAVALLGIAPSGAQASRAPAPRMAVLSDRYLRLLVGLGVLVAATEVCLDYGLKVHAADRFQDAAGLSRFFALYHAGCAGLTWALQSSATPWLLRRLGLAGAVAAWPVASLVGAVAASVIPGVVSAVSARATAQILAHSVFRSGYELLFTPVAVPLRRATKGIIDVGGARLGDAVGAGAILLLIYAWPEGATGLGYGLGGLLSVTLLVLVRRVHAGYVAALGRSLADGVIALSPEEVSDRTTAKTLAESQAIDRKQLLAAIGAMPKTVSVVLPDAERWQRLSQGLLAGSREERAAILRDPDAELLLSLVLLWLAHPEHGASARQLVRRALPNRAETVLGFVMERDGDPAGARAIEILGQHAAPRSHHALWHAMCFGPPSVRLSAGRELVRRAHQDQLAWRPTPAEVHAQVEAALREQRAVWSEVPAVVQKSPLVPAALRSRVAPSTEYILLLLGLEPDFGDVGMVLAGLSAEASAVQGTAWEYLENALPKALRARVLRHLGAPGAASPAAPSKRDREVVADELRRSVAALARPASVASAKH